MAQNVSSVRVAIQGDARGLNAELIKASKAVSDFGGKTNRSSVKGLDSQLSQVRRQLNEVAEQYVTGGKIQRTEIEKLVELEKRLKRQIEARNMAISAARKDFTPLPEVAAAASSSPLIALSSVDRQMTAIQRKGPNVNFIVSQLGFAAEDAAVSFGTSGLAGALRGASNNLSVVAMAFNPVAGIIVGVGTALAASLIPMLTRTKQEIDEGRRAADDMAASMRRLAKVTISARGLIARSSTGPLDVEGVTTRGKDRFGSQRADFKRQLSLEKLSKEQADRIASVESRLYDDQFFDKSVLPSGSTLEGLERQKEIRQRFQGFIESTERRLRSAYADSVAKGDVSRILETRGAILRDLRIEGGPEGLRTDALAEHVREQAASLVEIAGEAVVAKQNIDELESALSRLGKNEGIAKGAQSLVDALNPVFQVGGRFGDRFKDLSDAFGKEFGGPRARRESDPLQAGYQFGSIEAVSAINRATFARPDPVDKNIEKNTSKTVDAVIGVAREVKHMKTAVVSAVTNSIKVGAGL